MFSGRLLGPLARFWWICRAQLGSAGRVVLCWSYFIWTGNVSSIWPLFGVANQLLAVVALAVASTIIINLGRQKYVWITFLPLCFLATTTLTAGYLSVRDIFWPMAVGPNADVHIQGYVNSICTVIMLVCAVIIFCATAYPVARRPAWTAAGAVAVRVRGDACSAPLSVFSSMVRTSGPPVSKRARPV
jgi:carbon starvation protein